MRILDDQDAATRIMLVDMLNYGSAAQNTCNYGPMTWPTACSPIPRMPVTVTVYNSAYAYLH